MNSLIHIADRVLNRPLLITRDKAQVILSVLGARMGVNAPDASRFEGRNERDNTGQTKPYRVTEQGVGIITITGSLVARGAWVGANSGLTSYEGIQHQLKTAKTDDAVRTAIIDLHTPGGEAVLAFETAALVRELAAVKRTIAVVNGMAASAGYAIASGASEIVTAETGVSGSIGVVLLHADFSRQLDREGISPTLIHAGAHKVDGNPFEPLSAEVRDDLQAEVNAFYDAFLSTVAKGRGSRLSISAARKTEARTFIGKAAVDAGVADRVGSFESVLAELSRASGRKSVQTRRTSMENSMQTAADERDRFQAVMSSAHYKGREASAQHMLFDTDMAAEAICGVLGTLPAATAAKTEAAPAAATDGRGSLGISIVGARALQKSSHTINTSEIYGARRQAMVAARSEAASAGGTDVYAERRRAIGL